MGSHKKIDETNIFEKLANGFKGHNINLSIKKERDEKKSKYN